MASVAFAAARGVPLPRPVADLKTHRAPASPNAGGVRSLRAQAAARGLLAGADLRVTALRASAAYRQLAAEQCGIAAAVDAMTWDVLRPSLTDFSFDRADALVQFCEMNHIKIRGNDLCSHHALPAWFAHAATPTTARDLLQQHIRTVAGRYRGRMHSWDVVRDAVDLSGGRADGLRSSPWLEHIGAGYIETAFRTAREADPAALLTYTDTGIVTENGADAQKRTAVLLLLRRLRQRNIPIDAVGIQLRLQAGATVRVSTGLQSFLQECRAMDLEIFLTGMDIDSRALPANPVQRNAAAAAAYRSYLEALLPAGNVRAILFADLEDAALFSAAFPSPA